MEEKSIAVTLKSTCSITDSGVRHCNRLYLLRTTPCWFRKDEETADEVPTTIQGASMQEQ